MWCTYCYTQESGCNPYLPLCLYLPSTHHVHSFALSVWIGNYILCLILFMCFSSAVVFIPLVFIMIFVLFECPCAYVLPFRVSYHFVYTCACLCVFFVFVLFIFFWLCVSDYYGSYWFYSGFRLLVKTASKARQNHQYRSTSITEWMHIFTTSVKSIHILQDNRNSFIRVEMSK